MSPVTMNKIESALRTALKYVDLFNAQNIEALSALFTADCIFEPYISASNFSRTTDLSARDFVITYHLALFKQYPKGKLKVEEAFGLGHRSVLRWKYFFIEGDAETYLRGVNIFTEKDMLISASYSYAKE